MKLIACSECHTQYDVTGLSPDSAFDCRGGVSLPANAPETDDAVVRRCGGCGAIAKDQSELCDYCGAAIVQVVDRGSLICPECYARNLDDARFCLGCGVAFDPHSPLPSLSELRCPCCECWMTSREVGGLEIQECPKCNGLWAPENRFDSLVERTIAAVRERLPEQEIAAPRVDGGSPTDNPVEYRRCPACDALMNRSNFQKRSGVIIDRCHEHGTWLDAHELERIAGFVSSGRAERASRLEESLKSNDDKQAARDAARRVQGLAADTGSDYSIFGEKRNSSTVGTIFDLLIGILN